VASGDLDLMVLYLSHDYKAKTTAMQDRQINKRKTLLPGDNLYGKCMNAAVGMLRRLALGTSEINAMYRAQDIWDKLKVMALDLLGVRAYFFVTSLSLAHPALSNVDQFSFILLTLVSGRLSPFSPGTPPRKTWGCCPRW
jgi:hypothetical protein